MKIKSLLVCILLITGMSAQAQTMYDAYRYSNNNYYGTARTIAMGNAFTALGGDLGSIGINPAGSSVNKYSQFTITPNLSILGTKSGYNSSPSERNGYDTEQTRTKLRFTMPNFGITTAWRTGRRRGLKSITFGVVGNATANYLDRMSAFGENDQTSYIAGLASSATADGVSSDKLNSNYFDGGYNWRNMIAYQSGMIATNDDSKVNYIGATERINDNKVISLGGPLDQNYGRRSYGNKYDMQINIGFNISDKLFLGANLGLTSLNYESNSFFKESAINPKDFGIVFDHNNKTYFLDGTMKDYYNASGTGVYGKFGVIFVPIQGLRIGAAIQTPTSTNITEHWQYAGNTHFSERRYDAYASSNEGTYDYRLISPYRANFGVAYINKFGLISMDYEFCDYSSMEFRERGIESNNSFDLVNRLNSKFFGVEHSLRIGAEFRPDKQTSVRIGYNLTTSPECYWHDNDGIVDAGTFEAKYFDSKLNNNQFNGWVNSLHNKKYNSNDVHAISFGFGYQSSGSFFFDMACRTTFKKAFTYPYAKYTPSEDPIQTPEIRTKSNLWDVVATFGWKF